MQQRPLLSTAQGGQIALRLCEMVAMLHRMQTVLALGSQAERLAAGALRAR